MAQDHVTEVRFGPSLSSTPVVSVLMITYNHEQYIKQAIESVFLQDCDFPIELVIGEDCSTDRTREVVRDVCSSAPIPVRFLTSNRNVGMHLNFRRTLKLSCAEFVALLEADDFWTNRSKLSIQVASMRSDARIALCFHRVKVQYTNNAMKFWGEEGIELPDLPPGDVAAARLLRHDFLVPTCSVVLRRDSLRSLPKAVNRLCFLDIALWTLAAVRGNVICLDETMAVYRYGQGISTAFCQRTNRMHQTKALELVRPLAKSEQASILSEYIDARLRYECLDLVRSGENGRAFWWMLKIAIYDLSHFKFPRWTVANFLKAYAPRVYVLLGNVKNAGR